MKIPDSRIRPIEGADVARVEARGKYSGEGDT